MCYDGLTGLPEAIEATWPQSMVQTCVVHLIRASMRFVSYKDRKSVAAALKRIYSAPNEETARGALEEFAASDLGARYPQTIATTTRTETHTPHPRTHHHQLETSPRPTHHHLPRPNHPYL